MRPRSPTWSAAGFPARQPPSASSPQAGLGDRPELLSARRFIASPTRTGAGINAAARSTSRNAVSRAATTRSRHPPGRQTRPSPPRSNMFAATEMTVITTTPLQAPRVSEEGADGRDHDERAPGLTSPTVPRSRSSVNALMATSEIPKPRPAAAPSRTRCCALTRSIRCEQITSSASAMLLPSKRISAVRSSRSCRRPTACPSRPAARVTPPPG